MSISFFIFWDTLSILLFEHTGAIISNTFPFEKYTFSEKDMYRSLDYFCKFKEELELLLWKNTKEKYKRNLNQVSINQEVNNIDIDSQEVAEIKQERNMLVDKLNNLEDNIPNIVESILNNMK